MSKLQRLGEIILGGIIVDCFIYLTFWLWEGRNKKKIAILPAQNGGKFEILSDKVFHEALFFPEPKEPCRFHYDDDSGCHRKVCRYSHNAQLLEQFLAYLNSAKKSMDICQYLISSYVVSQTILKIQSRGVRVRVLTDGNFSDDATSKVGRLRAQGIAVRCNPPGKYMHHKFAIIDDTIMMSGSFNWTWEAVTGNHENLCITNNPGMVEPYFKEFKRLWDMYDPKLKKIDNDTTMPKNEP